MVRCACEKYERLIGFIGDRHEDVSPMKEGKGVFATTNKVLIDEGIEGIKGYITNGGRVLDAGIGRGYAMECFTKMGLDPVGITISLEEQSNAQLKGFDVKLMDMSFMEFEDNSFDVVWARHCLEHSPFPYFTLTGFYRVLKPGGILYSEVPAPKTTSHHENNKNHYSVFGKQMWSSLMKRCGFERILAMEILIGGDIDKYYRFIHSKGAFDGHNNKS